MILIEASGRAARTCCAHLRPGRAARDRAVRTRRSRARRSLRPPRPPARRPGGSDRSSRTPPAGQGPRTPGGGGPPAPARPRTLQRPLQRFRQRPARPRGGPRPPSASPPGARRLPPGLRRLAGACHPPRAARPRARPPTPGRPRIAAALPGTDPWRSEGGGQRPGGRRRACTAPAAFTVASLHHRAPVCPRTPPRRCNRAFHGGDRAIPKSVHSGVGRSFETHEGNDEKRS